jgi:hypothetical protein
LILLWLELKKLALAGLRLAAGLFLALAMLNLGVGAAAIVDTQSVSSADSAAPGQVATGQLLHLQLFGFWHVHESLDQSEDAPPPAGVTEQDEGVLPSPPARFLYLSHGNRLDSDFGSGAVQKSLTDFTDPHPLVGVAGLASLARQTPADDGFFPNPFLKVPLKPPIS